MSIGLLLNVCVFVSVVVRWERNVHMNAGTLRDHGALRSPGTGVIGGCESPDMSTGN